MQFPDEVDEALLIQSLAEILDRYKIPLPSQQASPFVGTHQLAGCWGSQS